MRGIEVKCATFALNNYSMPARVKNINAFDLFLLKALINLKINEDYKLELDRSQKQKLCRNYYGKDIDKNTLPEILINISEDHILRIMPQAEEISRDISITKLDELCKILRKNYSWHEVRKNALQFRPEGIKDDVPFERLDKQQQNAIKKRLSEIFDKYKKFEAFEKGVINSNTSQNEDFKNEVTNTSAEVKAFAKRIYIELKTRKAAIPIDEDKDVIEEVYDSWYKLFCVIRDELKLFPATNLNDIENPESPVGLAMKILNEVLRPHLTEHQSKYRSWLETAKRNPRNKNITPQELQKKFPNYEALLKSMKEVNKALIEIAQNIREDIRIETL